MADERIVNAVKLVDPTTTSQEAAVDASGNLQVILAANSGVDIGDVDVASIVPGTGATNLGKAEDAAHTTGDTGVMGLTVRQDVAAALAGTDGDYQPLITDASGRLHIASAPANDGVDIGDVDVTSIVPGTGATSLGKAEDAAHSTGDTGVFCLAVRQDTAAQLAGADGDYTALITDANGRLHVTDPNAGAGSPSTPTYERATAASVAAGTETTTEIRTSDLGGNTRRLAGIDITASVAWRASINQVDDDVDTEIATLFGRAGETVQWRPPHKDYTENAFSANAGFDGWEAEITNKDTSQAADLYSTFYYED